MQDIFIIIVRYSIVNYQKPIKSENMDIYKHQIKTDSRKQYRTQFPILQLHKL